MNLEWSRELLEKLSKAGVQDFVVCAGARNGPLVLVLASSTGARRYAYFDERAAGFFALGLARRVDRPVAIVTTSGTAVAELLPAVCEAFHSGVPLIVVSADRPARLRATGAPQTMNQVGIFSTFVERSWDLDGGALFDLKEWSMRAPLHLNVCFDEPVLSGEARPSEFKIGAVANFLGRSRGAGGPEGRFRAAPGLELGASVRGPGRGA